MQHKRIYHYPKSPDATPLLRTVTIPTELVMGLWIAMRGEPKKPE